MPALSGIFHGGTEPVNKKELREIRRRVRPDRTNIQHIYGCYVNSQKEIISTFDESLALLSQEEQEKYISILKKTLSGALGRNLLDISFTTRQVVDGDEHKLLSALRRTELKDTVLLDEFYKAIVSSLNLENMNYLILLAFDAYDVPQFDKNGEKDGESNEVFNYILCSICPVKTGKPVLSYSNEENRFHNLSLAQVVASPELGFMFPSFDDRSANIYNALFYSRDTKGVHEDFVDAVFKTEAPLSPLQQKEAFSAAVSSSLEKECSFDVLQSVHEELRERIELHKESKDPDPLTVTADDVCEILEKSGVSEERREAFIASCNERFGDNKPISPDNIINSRKFEISTEKVKISVSPEYSGFIRTQIIDGKKYILIPAEAGAEVNGIPVII